WLISMAMAGGIVLNTISGIPYGYGMTIILLVCVIYTLFGGLYAVTGTDFIESVLILLGVVVVGGTMVVDLEIGGVDQNGGTQQPALLHILLPASLLVMFNNLLCGFGEIFHNHVRWSCACATRKGVGGKAYFLAGLCWLPIP